jgi:hypothetical protein
MTIVIVCVHQINGAPLFQVRLTNNCPCLFPYPL